MAYDPQSWANSPAATTPLSAPRMEHIEAGIQDAAADADTALGLLNQRDTEYYQELVWAMLRAGTGITLTYDDPGGLITITSTGGGGTAVTVANISGASTLGRTLMAVADAAAARTAINAQVAGDYVLTTALNSSVDSRIATIKGQPNGLGSLGADGKLLSSQLPELAITRSFPVASQAAMLALTAELGDVAVRTDVAQNYILSAEPATTLANWIQLGGSAGAVTSVAGRTGAITLSAADITNSTAVGRSLMTAASAQTARDAIGAQEAGAYATAADLSNKIITIDGTVAAVHVWPTAGQKPTIAQLDAAGVPLKALIGVKRLS